VAVVGQGRHGLGVDLGETLALLARDGVLQALVEGGPTVHGALLDAGLVDRLVAYVAPLVLGAAGRAGYGLDPGPPLAQAPRLRLTGVTAMGDDVCLEYDAIGR
jgi:diaminohydroxyphosphoribosylaminopyrimidine deaminase/5-amino-6-(5-phosphoribosylamino)uracil reductase